MSVDFLPNSHRCWAINSKVHHKRAVVTRTDTRTRQQHLSGAFT